MSSGGNHNINGANHVKWSESQYRSGLQKVPFSQAKLGRGNF